MKKVVANYKSSQHILLDSPEYNAYLNKPIVNILNGATGNVFIAEDSGDRSKSSSTLISELNSYETAANPAASPYSIGAWYYPGWMTGDSGSFYQPDPWAFIRPYPDRIPLMGEYNDDNQLSADNHIRVAKSYGIDWFGVVWFAKGVDGSDSIVIPPKPAAAMACMLNSSFAGNGFGISLLWDMQITSSIDKDGVGNATSARFLARFDAVCTAIAGLIQANPTKWSKRDGKYTLTIRGEYWTTNFVARSGLSSSALLTRMRNTMATASTVINTEGLHIAYWGTASGDRVRAQAGSSGFDSWTSYGYISSIINKDGSPSAGPAATNYANLSSVFKTENTWLTTNSANIANPIKFTVPLCGGWEATPWSGLVIGRPTPEEFKAHLLEQKTIIDNDLASSNSKTQGWAVICTWNEHGEGSGICPTKEAGYALVQKIIEVFKP